MIKKYGLLSLTLTGILTWTAGCRPPPVEEPEVARPVKIVTAGSAAVGIHREFPGTIMATRHADLSFEVPGRMIERLVNEGQEVKQGEVLARLDDTDLQASLLQAVAGLRKAQADLDRSLRIREEDQGAISASKIDADQKAMEVLEAEVAMAEKAVQDTALKAPFDGMIARRLVENFQNVQAKEPIFAFQDLSELEIEISLPERDIVLGHIRSTPEEITELSNPVVQISALPEHEFPAQASEFSARADPDTRTFQVRFVFKAEGDASILPGMTARVAVTLPGEDIIRLPSHAVFADEGGQSQVWTLNPDAMTVHAKPVKPGNLTGDEVTIEEGLSQGDQIVVSGISQLREGLKVRRHER